MTSSEENGSKQTIAKNNQKEEPLYEPFSSMTNMFEAVDIIYFSMELTYDKQGKPIDGIFCKVNTATERLLGKSREQLIGKSRKELFGDVFDELPKKFDDVVKTGKPAHYEGYGAALKKYYDIYAWKIGKNQVDVILRDITEQKKSEEELRKSEEKYSSLFTNMIDGLGYCRTLFDEQNLPVDIICLEINDAFTRITGLKKENVVGKTITEVLPGIQKTQPKLFEVFGKVALSGKTEKFEIFFKPLRLWVSVSMYSPKKGDVVIVFEDINERKKMEQEVSNSLKESRLHESEISALLKASRTVLQNKEFPDSARAIFDGAKELLGATAGYVALLSDDGKENIVLFLDSGGLPCIVDPSLPMPIRGLRAEAYNSGKVAIENDFPQSEWQKFSPEGHMRLKNVLFAPLKIEQRTVGVIGLANKPGDFTKRDAEMAMAFGELASIALANGKMLEMLEENEKELKIHSDHLERLVEERTKQLKDTERLAAIGATAGMVGHDIRNPLQAITGDVYLLKTELVSMPESEDKKSVIESLDGIEKNIDYINKIVADLQDYARPLKPNAEQTDLKLIIDELLKKSCLPENIKVNVNVEGDDGKFETDATFISRIMNNLVNNAVQAMPNGGKLTIHAYKKAKEVIITVKDTGVGIPEAAKDKLFTPMFTTKSKGQGFGLSVVKRMTEALCGTVSFESEEGKGTTFTIRLPSKGLFHQKSKSHL